MCIIIYNKDGRPIPEKHLELCYENNEDGFGVMYASEGRVKAFKAMFELEHIKEIEKNLRGGPYAMHFRYATVGEVNDTNLHPHQILDADADGEDLWMMHNGTFMFLRKKGYKDKKTGKFITTVSDSVLFAEKIRQIVLELGSDILFDQWYQDRLSKYIGGNKILFMNGHGQVAIINEKKGWRPQEGLWYSNRYSLEKGYRKRQIEDAQRRKLFEARMDNLVAHRKG